MIKKILALAATALFSMNASAGYIEYQLTGAGVGSSPGTGANVVVIRDEDKSVAYYSISTPLGTFYPSEPGTGYHRNSLIESTTSFTGLGPTNMYMHDTVEEAYDNRMWILFGASSEPGTFNYSMRVLSEVGPHSPYPLPTRDFSYTGTATQVALDASIEQYLASFNGQLVARDVPYYDPTQVPEPASLALMAIGVLGVIGIGRRNSRAA